MPKKKVGRTFVSFLLDETGSMQSIKGSTISAYNEYVNTLRNDTSTKDVVFTLTKFNSGKVEVVHDAIALADVEELTNKTFQPANLTPLYDAIGATVRAVEAKIEKNDRALVIILTDGQENASKEWSRARIFDLVKEKEKEGNWTFVYLGANQDAWLESGNIGIAMGNTQSFQATDVGTQSAVHNLATQTRLYASSRSASTTSFYNAPWSTTESTAATVTVKPKTTRKRKK